MNCKPGDLAIVIRSRAGNEGKIVRILHWVGEVPGWVGRDRWAIDITLPGLYGGASVTVRDSCVRPIQDPDDDAQDETLQWLPSPAREGVTA